MTGLYPATPKSILIALRLEGLLVLAGAVAAYAALGGSWWLFALLLLAPDVALPMAGSARGAKFYNLVHTYAVPAMLLAIGHVTGTLWLGQVGIIWIAHIGMDRAFGFGLKYPKDPRFTHLGMMGGKTKRAAALAHAR